jgi:hypothetical protein
MNKPNDPIFTTRPTVTLELPLSKHARILHPEQVTLKIGDHYHDLGALCYALRSDKMKRHRQPRDVVINSLIKQRPKQILQITKALSSLITDGGKSVTTTGAYAWAFKMFMNWADKNGLNDCLAGGDATRYAFRAWASHIDDFYKRQEFNERYHNSRLMFVCELLEATTGLAGLMRGIRLVRKNANPNGGTEPLALRDLSHAVALNQCLFDGLCDLVLEMRPFPHKLILPGSLGWDENHLWVFPTTIWNLPPHQQDDAVRARSGSNSSWPYDYTNGRLATVDEVMHRYRGRSETERRHNAIKCIKRSKIHLEKANTDAHNSWRLSLAMHAQRAFMFLFYCNTGANTQVVRDLETDGYVDATVKNQKFRGLKWRAGGKEVNFYAPTTFLPRLRRFMELRQYLLQGRKTPYLFFTCGRRNNTPPTRTLSSDLELHYKNLLLKIDPQLPRMGSRALRASVDNYYLWLHDAEVASAVMGHTLETEEKHYARGSIHAHYEEMSLFMAAVSESALRQRVIPVKDMKSETRPLEEGGRCNSFGHPESLAPHVPVHPDCNESQGCLFCNHRVLAAGEEDARKVASVAYLLEQLILGPKHEEALRPLISKCDEDLKKIAAFPHCRVIVEKVLKDVYENENLTPYWADKYQLFLELGVIV